MTDREHSRDDLLESIGAGPDLFERPPIDPRWAELGAEHKPGVRIGYISADFGVDVFGYAGNSVHVRELIEAFRRAGHAVHLVSPAIAEDPPAEHQFRPGDPPIHLERLPAPPRHVDLFDELGALDERLGMRTRVRQELRNLLYNLTLLEHGVPHLREAGVDFIYERYAFVSGAGVRIARALGVPHLLEVNAPLSEEQERRAGVEMRALARELECRILSDTDHAFAVSEAVRRFAIDSGTAPENVSVLPNAVDPARFSVPPETRSAVRQRLDLADRCVIGFAGGLKPFHGTELLIEAFAALQPREAGLHLLIVGDGPERERLTSVAAELGVTAETTFTGRVPYPEVPGHLAAMDIAVAPGVRDDFYFSPLKLYEYMASGLAVVAGDVGQPRELISDGVDGRLFAAGDAQALTEVLGELASAPELRARLGACARERIEREYTWDRNAARVIAIAEQRAG